MNKIKLGRSGVEAPQIGLGCMRIAGLSAAQGEKLIRTAMENGINFFDHADIYGGGECESFFAKVFPMNADLREKVILQTKCGIRQGCFNFFKEHVLASVDASLARLKTATFCSCTVRTRSWSRRRLRKRSAPSGRLGRSGILA